jgi:hypothetical protein
MTVTAQTRAGDSRTAVVEALTAFTAETDGHKPWMAAAELALRAGASSAADPQFEADVQALFNAGVIRLMSGGNAGGGSFYKAMLVPPPEPDASTTHG